MELPPPVQPFVPPPPTGVMAAAAAAAAAAGFVVLGLPQGSVLRVDCAEPLRTGVLFQGMYGVKSGVHVLCVAPKEEGGSAERSVVFFNVGSTEDDGDVEMNEEDGGEMEEVDAGKRICLVLQWNEEEERLVNVIQAAQSGDGERDLREQYQRGVQRGELNGMGPCRSDENEDMRWKILTRHVDEKLLRSIGIEFGDVLGTCDEPAPFVLNVDKKSHETQALEQMKKREKPRYAFTRIIGSGPHHDIRRPHASMTPEEVTKHNMDGSDYLASLVAAASSSSMTSSQGGSSDAHDNVGATRLLGEMAVSFLLFITVMSAEGFRHWKGIVALVCACAPNAGGASLDVFRSFVELLTAQMQVVDDSFFDEAELALDDGARGRDAHFFARSLSRLVHNVDDMACDIPKNGAEDARVLFRCVATLKKLMKEKFGITLETAYCGGEEYEPTIVAIDDNARDTDIHDALHENGMDNDATLPATSSASSRERMSWMLPQGC